MALVFDERQLLHPGVHDATLEEIEQHFALSNRRRVLFKNLKQYVADVKLTTWMCRVLIDGSFVMPLVAEPNDIDLILVLPDDWDWSRTDFRPFEYNVLDRKYTKREYKIEVYPVPPSSEAEQKFLELFTQVRVEWCRQFGWETDSRKGLVRIIL